LTALFATFVAWVVFLALALYNASAWSASLDPGCDFANAAALACNLAVVLA